ncbi:hypothetical protein AMTR_s00023p00249610 [Amborella trichopoda]|uniref:Uncharacterized protein n=1 Tax=Amborella trichopoda TaxID=13333 RepID=W1NJT0_AMBTC|nr:hypothetical protein AMTR_s00023p00249610 [Amborella trichopoda]
MNPKSQRHEQSTLPCPPNGYITYTLREGEHSRRRATTVRSRQRAAEVVSQFNGPDHSNRPAHRDKLLVLFWKR